MFVKSCNLSSSNNSHVTLYQGETPQTGYPRKSLTDGRFPSPRRHTGLYRCWSETFFMVVVVDSTSPTVKGITVVGGGTRYNTLVLP